MVCNLQKPTPTPEVLVFSKPMIMKPSRVNGCSDPLDFIRARLVRGNRLAGNRINEI